MKKKRFFVDFAAMIVATLALLWLWYSLLSNLDGRFDKVDDDYAQGIAVNLSSDTDKEALSAVIQNNMYAENKKDADFIAGVLVDRLKRMDYPSLYALQKRNFGQVPAKLVDSCEVLVETYMESCGRLGQMDSYDEYKPTELGQGKIIVRVSERVVDSSKSSRIVKFFSRIFPDDVPCVGDTVRLLSYYRDSSLLVHTDTLGFLSTDSTGVAMFEGLDTSASYSVLPIRKGFEYGFQKGTTKGKLAKYDGGTAEFSFSRKEHLVPLFGNSTISQIRKDKTITVRTPEEYKSQVSKWFVSVLLGWWVIGLVLFVRRKKFDGLLVASGLFLTGLSVLMMFSVQDSLTDELKGVMVAKGIMSGIVIAIVLLFVDFEKFYQNRCKLPFDMPLRFVQWLFFKQYKDKVAGLTIVMTDKSVEKRKKIIPSICWFVSLPLLILDIFQLYRLGGAYERMCNKLPKGIGWLFLALFVTALLWVPGIGESVGGMKVNVNLFGLRFQPSEIAKYLIMFSMAGFFATNADNIITYSRRAKNIGKKIKSLLWVIIGLSVLMIMYMGLGDMGPSLVICVTFILLYSIVISKVDLENVDDNGKWKRIFTCDFALLVYGVLSFVGFVLLGKLLWAPMYFAVLWFLVWIVAGLLLRKQLFETAVLMNLIIFVFLFGGTIMEAIPGIKGSDTAERFEKRMEMCKNPWGDLDIEHSGKTATPVSNTQVANGLWGLASGGFEGQGLAKGNPNTIPAYHTDMILSSTGEQLGWFGLFVVVVALGIMVWRIMWIGHGSCHPFTFYLCMGFAIVISVQFFIIALGSSGMIPLTGITVPFLSYGTVSMILNITAVGIVLSISQKQYQKRTDGVAGADGLRRRNVEQYGYPIAIISLVFIVMAVSTLMVWQFYQLWNRSKTIVHPVYVLSKNGEPLVEYNPRINIIMKSMLAGRVYDRNGVILATSDKNDIDIASYVEKYGLDKSELELMSKRRLSRYYPFGKHLFFMLGDINNGIYFRYDEKYPVGYMAEAQHLSYLRGFDNVYRDKSGNPIRLKGLLTKELKDNPYLESRTDTASPIMLRDYSPLIVFLEDGIEGMVLGKHNECVRKGMYDLHLTVDAKLQIDIQNGLAEYVEKNSHLKNNRFLRISVVVLDAEEGDLLASANYPLPDYERLRIESDNYSDNYKDKNWKAYTDRDLGTTYQTFPGSTAKVMSAMAGLRKLGTDAASVTYSITNEEAIDISEKKKCPVEPTIDNPNEYYRRDPVTMKDAIVLSSNCYFINLINDKDLFGTLGEIYEAVGVSICSYVPYFFTEKADTLWKEKFEAKISENRKRALSKYRSYCDDVAAGKRKKMSAAEWKWAWGQGYNGYELQASPLNMARLASVVVNGGMLQETEYLMGQNVYEKDNRSNKSVRVIKDDEAEKLKEYMLAEAANQFSRNRISLPSYIGGKTGTPERYRLVADKKKTHTYNDGWYMFFVEGDETHHPLSVVVRMERLPLGSGSGQAVRLAENVVIGELEKNKYIKSELIK